MLRLFSLVYLISLATVTSAELKPLDDKDLKDIEGKAGITIDLETKLSIGEIMMKFGNAGSLVVRGVRVGGHDMNKDNNEVVFDKR